MAKEIRQARICNMAEKRDITAELLDGTELKLARRALTKEQWLKLCLQIIGTLAKQRKRRLRTTPSCGKGNGNDLAAVESDCKMMRRQRKTISSSHLTKRARAMQTLPASKSNQSLNIVRFRSPPSVP